MAEVSGNARVGATGVVSRALRRWPEWMSYAVTTWSLACGLLGLWWVGASLATIVVVGGAVLTLGLVQRWGEDFPRRIPFLSGIKRVPIPLGVVPALLVSVLVTTADLMFVRLTLAGALVGSFSFFGEGKLALGGENWAALVPELLWPLWGFALGAATLAYYGRRGGVRVLWTGVTGQRGPRLKRKE